MMKDFEELKQFYYGKKVLLTGHTGFKGSYLTVLLALMGAEVYGYALPAPTEPSLFETLFGPGSSKESRKELKLLTGDDAAAEECAVPGEDIVLKESCIGDVRDFEKLNSYVNRIRPDVIIHMAAQPIVRESYRIPRETFEANVMGTVNLLEALRLYTKELKDSFEKAEAAGAAGPENAGSAAARDKNGGTGRGTPRVSFLNVTTDKVYLNEEKPGYAYREEDKLDGYDPYSNSKSCSELVTHSYRSAFFNDGPGNRIEDVNGIASGKEEPIVRISTARAGNVIGGGDFAKDRIIPDCMRAVMAGQPLTVRNPFSTRPYQHVLEPLTVYLTIAAEQYGDDAKQGYYNVGPDLRDCVTTGELCDLYRSCAEDFSWESQAQEGAPHEADFLRLDNTRIKDVFGWQPKWHIGDAVKASVDWSNAYRRSPEASNLELLRQINNYVN